MNKAEGGECKDERSVPEAPRASHKLAGWDPGAPDMQVKHDQTGVC